MVRARQRDERRRVVEQAAWVWLLAQKEATAFGILEYVRCGAMPGGEETRIPYIPEVEQKVAEIHANGGRLIVEPEHGE